MRTPPAYHPPMARLTRSIGIRPGEGRLVALVAAVFATIEVARGFGEIAADSLVIGRFGAGSLPWLFIGLGLASLVASLAFGAALGRVRRGPLFVGVLLVLGAIIGAEQLALVAGAPIVPLVWLTVYAAGTVAATLVWTLAGSVLDARQAKRLFPLCTSAAIVGSFVGTLGAGPAARLVGTEWVVALEVVGLAASAVLVARLSGVPAGGRLRAAPPRRPMSAELRAGFDFVVRSPLMRLVAVAYVLFSVLMFSVTSPFFRAMSEAFPAGASADLTTALGLLSAAVTATAFVVSVVVAPRVYARFGVATAALVLPLVYVAGFGLWIAAFTPVTAVIVRYAQQVTQRGLSNAAWSAFYNVVPAARRPQVLAFNDGVPGQLGIVLSGVLLLTVQAILAPEQIPWLGMIAAVVCTAVVLGIRRRYADSLVRALRAGLGERVLEGGPGLAALAADGQATTALVRALDAPEPAVRRMAADLLGRLRVKEAARAIAALATDPEPAVRAASIAAVAALDEALAAPLAERAVADADPTVRAAAVEAAGNVAPAVVTGSSDRLADDPDPNVRAALAIALVACGRQDLSAEIAAALVASPDPDARVAGMRALAHLDEPGDPATGRPDPLLAGLDDEAASVRRAAAAALRARPVPSPAIFALLADGTARSQEAALWALDGHADAAREPVLRWAEGQAARAAELGGRLRALDRSTGSGESLAFLIALLDRRREEILRRLLTGLAVLGAPEAGGLIRRCLRSSDPDIRAQAIEALDSIGDPGLRGAIVELVDSPEDGADPDEETVLRDLADDADEWIRALALRARAERVAAEWSTIRERARTDPEPIVRGALGRLGDGGEPPMPDTASTLSDVDRMLVLRRVPLFADLVPEDLQRIAMTAVERLYAPDETVVREGDLGDELIVIVEGAVRVVHLGEDGTEQLLMRYVAGDHFGELAVLREAPRAATVLADPPGVRGLGIRGESLTAILRERPEAAMAMLATLATRLSRQ
jgi:HEAT repeat protein